MMSEGRGRFVEWISGNFVFYIQQVFSCRTTEKKCAPPVMTGFPPPYSTLR
jgi:hypothetical protein